MSNGLFKLACLAIMLFQLCDARYNDNSQTARDYLGQVKQTARKNAERIAMRNSIRVLLEHMPLVPDSMPPEDVAKLLSSFLEKELPKQRKLSKPTIGPEHWLLRQG